MTLNPIIDVKIEEFKNEFSLKGNEDKIFEEYVNYQILKRKYPEFISDTDLFDKICVGGGYDMGIDGIIISINDQPISSIEEAKDIIINRDKISIELTFIQSKNKSSFEQKEFVVFKEGIEDFLREKLTMPANDKIKNWHAILEEICKRENLKKWKKQPEINIYYITTGKWANQEYILAAINSLNEHIAEKKTYNIAQVYCVDAEHLLKIIDENEDEYVITIKVEQKIGLPKVEGVESSSVYLCKAESLMELLKTEDGNLRKDLFEDNVRDFQGYTNINSDVKETISKKPDQFLLLNNGITIVCRYMNDPNMELVLEAPQIVNGCQTCNILYECDKEEIDLKNIYVMLKVISCKDDEIINNVVKGTNRQNIVYEEALETTRNYHKLLEDFFMSYQKMNKYPKLYYERRSKQYRNNYQVKVDQKVNLRMITQSFVSVFLERPDQGIHHELTLLKLYRTKLFQDTISFYPYYTSAFLYKNIDNLFRKNELPEQLKSFELHIIYIVKELIMKDEKRPKYFNGKEIDDYCEKLLSKISNPQTLIEYAKYACDFFSEISDKWVHEKGENFWYGRKDSEEFTDYIVKGLGQTQINVSYVGKIARIGSDRYGNIYGFIKNEPDDIFFHSANNNQLVTYEYENRMVSYEMSKDSHGNYTPVNIQLLSE